VVKLLVDSAVVDTIEFDIPVGKNGSFSLTSQPVEIAAGTHSIDLQASGPGSSSGTANNCVVVGWVVNV
jgi:hypothetical protein